MPLQDQGGKADPFLSPPYTDCPTCNARGSLGVLMVNRRSYVRRCGQCRSTESIALPTLDRRLIYLDQMALSNLAKAQGRDAPGTEEESYWTSVLNQLLKLALSAEMEFHDYATIRNGQLYQHAQLWEEERGDEEPALDVDRVIEGDRHGWQPRLLIDARFPVPNEFVDELNRTRMGENDGLTSVWARWAAEDVSFEDWFQQEASSYGPVVIAWIAARETAMAQMPYAVAPRLIDDSAAVTFVTVQRALQAAGVPRERLTERATEYLRSDALVNVPFNRISSLLYAGLARRARAGQKGVSRGMTTDIRMLSVLLPYCDAVFVDRECHELLTEKPISERLGYETELFSHRNKDEFLTYLAGIEASARPEHLALVEEVYGPI